MNKTVNFRVDPQGLTRIVRDLWAEGSFDRALRVLHVAKVGDPLPLETQHDIIRGKKRFALASRKDPYTFCIKSDRWSPKNLTRYPDPARLAEFLMREAEEKEEREAARNRRRGVELDEEREDDFPRMKRYGGFDSLEEMNMAMLLKQQTPSSSEYLEIQKERDRREKQGIPKPDKTLAANMGWILPDGKFYACLTKMEHVWLAGVFGLSEVEAENAGWIKISTDLFGKVRILRFSPDPTQKQINTVFDWCQKHKSDLPDWAGGKDE